MWPFKKKAKMVPEKEMATEIKKMRDDGGLTNAQLPASFRKLMLKYYPEEKGK